MFKLIFLSTFFLIQTVCHGQCLFNHKQDTAILYLESTDGIICNISFREKDPVTKINIGKLIHPKYNLIYSIKVDTVFYNYDSAGVPNAQIMKTAFLLIDDSKNLRTDTVNCISLIKTNLPEVVMFGRVIPSEILKHKKFRFHAVITKVSIKSKKLRRIINKAK